MSAARSLSEWFFLRSLLSTFNSTNDAVQLVSVCRELAKQTVDELISDRILCKRVTLKMKTVNFEVLTRSKTLNSYTDSLTAVTEKAVALLKHELDQELELPALRLMGEREMVQEIELHWATYRRACLRSEDEEFRSPDHAVLLEEDGG